MIHPATVLAAVLLATATACAVTTDEPDLDAAAEFEALPIYWLGETFEGHDLERISGLDGVGPGVTLGYGTCTPSGAFEPSCTEPLQIQITPLCNHLDAVARNRVWRTRSIRAAPVGTIDGAPVLFLQPQRNGEQPTHTRIHAVYGTEQQQHQPGKTVFDHDA